MHTFPTRHPHTLGGSKPQSPGRFAQRLDGVDLPLRSMPPVSESSYTGATLFQFTVPVAARRPLTTIHTVPWDEITPKCPLSSLDVELFLPTTGIFAVNTPRPWSLGHLDVGHIDVISAL